MEGVEDVSDEADDVAIETWLLDLEVEDEAGLS